MSNKFVKFGILFIIIIFTFVFVLEATVPTPTLKWRNGGYKFNGQYNKGYYVSPATLDVNGDGVLDVIFANFWVMALDGATGNAIWSCYAGTDMSDPTNNSRYNGTHTSVVVAHINNDGQEEIVTGMGNGWLAAYDKNGYFLSGFPLQPVGRTDRIQSLSVFDLDNNGDMEIVIGWAKANNLNTCVIEHNGAIRTGWPQYQPNENANALGIFNANIAVGDLTGNGYGEIISPSDTNKMCAYYRDGSTLPASDVFDIGDHWGGVPCYISYADELVGWSPPEDEHDIYLNTDQPAVIADVNNDGTNEVVVVVQGFSRNVVPGTIDHETKYLAPMIFNIDRTRFNQDGFNWEAAPQTGGPLSNDIDEIVIKTSNPVVVDLDGDGNKEILTSSYDGKVHAYWLDKTEHHSWPFSVYSAGEGTIRFASEPSVVDLDGDGSLEVLFATWPEYDSYLSGHLYILNYKGEQLHKIALPYGNSAFTPAVPDVSKANFDGGLAAPTVADIDDDGQPEILVGMAFAGVAVYDLPGVTMGAAPWPTGRHDYARTAWDGFGSFEVTSPNGGETVDGGFVTTVTWSSIGISDNVKIEYSTNNGSSWSTITADTTNDGSYAWEAPQTTAGNCLIRVGNANGTITDESDAVFAIQYDPAEDNDFGHGVVQTSDGGYLVAGSTNSFGQGGYDMVIYKLNASGQKMWCKTYGGAALDEGWSISATSDGGCVIAGISESFTNGDKDFLAYKLDSAGNKVWRKNYGGTLIDEAYAVTQTIDGGFAMLGSSTSFTSGGTDFLIFKANAGGDKVWRYNFGGASDDDGYTLLETATGGLVIFGQSTSFTFGGTDLLAYKLSPYGAKQGRKNFGSAGNEFAHGHQGIVVTSDSGYLMAGSTDTDTAGGADLILYKVTKKGVFEWNKTYGGTSDDLGGILISTSDGGFLLGGYTNSFTNGGNDFLVYKLNSSANKQWRQNYGGVDDDILHSVIQTSDGGYLLVGETLSYVASSGYPDMLVYKVDSSGNVQWSKNL